MPDYPWVAKGPQAKDFLGNEFLTWLWHAAEHRGGAIATDAGEVTVMFDKLMDLDCASAKPAETRSAATAWPACPKCSMRSRAAKFRAARG